MELYCQNIDVGVLIIVELGCSLQSWLLLKIDKLVMAIEAV